MKISISNIALPEFHHDSYFHDLRAMGFEGLEVATSRVWPGRLIDVSFDEIRNYRKKVNSFDLEIVGLHSLLYGLDGYNLFASDDGLYKLVDYFKLLANVCGELGGKSLIFGSGRNRNGLAYDTAMSKTYHFLELILPVLEENDIFICFEPLSKYDSDFINTVSESLAIVDYFSSPNIQIQIDVKAVIENDYLSSDLILESMLRLKHVHANTPGLGAVGPSYLDFHNKIAVFLNTIHYDKYLSIEQIMIDEYDILGPIKESFDFIENVYK